MTKDEALKLALEALKQIDEAMPFPVAKLAQKVIKEALAQPEHGWTPERIAGMARLKEAQDKKLAQPEHVAWKYDVTYNQDGTVSVELPNGDELRIVLPNQQEPYCWTWDVWVSGGKWRAEYGWEKPTEKVVNLQPLYTTPPQRKPLTEQKIGAILEDTNAFGTRLYTFARAIEAAHGIKGEA